jgi:hypothetical protein
VGFLEGKKERVEGVSERERVEAKKSSVGG